MGKDKIKVVRIISRLNIGGPAIHTILLTEALNKELFETYLIAGKPDTSEGDMLSLAGKRGLNIEYIPELGREIAFRDIIAFFKILRFILKVKPQIVHTHTAKAGTLGRLAAILAGVQIKIHTFHGHVLDGYFNPFKTGIFIFIERSLAYFTDKVIVISEAVRHDIIYKWRIAPENKCVLIRIGLDLDRFLASEALKGDLRRKIDVDQDSLLVGIVGRLVPIKNHRMFLDASKIVLSGAFRSKAKFVIIGDGELKDDLTAYAKNIGVDSSVIFVGWMADMASVYADLDIVALTSLNEGTPVSLIEAMASSKPVIATDVGGVRDVITEGRDGLLVKKNDVNDFSGKLTELLNDKNKRSLFGASGRASVMNKYSGKRLVADIENLYDACLKKR